MSRACARRPLRVALSFPPARFAAPPERAAPLYEAFVAHLRGLGLRVGMGVFGAHMEVEIRNDGPVTILVES